MKANLVWNINCSFKIFSSTKLNYSARYTLYGQKTGLDKSLSASSSQGFVEVALRWDKQSTLLEEPPLDSNAVMVNIIYFQMIFYIP